MADKEVLVVASKVKAYIKSQTDDAYVIRCNCCS